jgi:hypothetical protein
VWPSVLFLCFDGTDNDGFFTRDVVWWMRLPYAQKTGAKIGNHNQNLLKKI